MLLVPKFFAPNIRTTTTTRLLPLVRRSQLEDTADCVEMHWLPHCRPDW